VELGRTLLGKEQADRKAANLTKGSRVLTALSGSDWGWTSDLLQKVYQPLERGYLSPSLTNSLFKNTNRLGSIEFFYSYSNKAWFNIIICSGDTMARF
jgi:hypothetical protein